MKGRIARVAITNEAVITIVTADKASARDWWDTYRDIDVDVSVKKYRQKRSLDANALLWKLVGDIAFVLGYTKEEVYIEQVKAVGVYDTITLKNEAVDTFTRAWKANGTGWMTETIGINRADKSMTDVICYYGSSVYDTAQFARLIDNVIAECKELSIPFETGYMKSLLGEDK